MRILITGGGGFQGSHLTEYWLKKGHEITVLSTWSDRSMNNLADVEKDIRVIWGSITDREVMNKSVRGHDVIVHLAARINVDESIGEPGSVVAVNVIGTQNVLDAAVKHGVRVINSSSCEVYGSSEPSPIKETNDLRPHSPYAAGKAGADRLTFAYHKTYDLDVCVMRPSNIYGERQKETGGGALIPIFVGRALEGKPLTIFGTGDQEREYLHVQDLVQAYDLILNRSDTAGEIYNAGSGESVSVKFVADRIAERTGVKLENGPARPGEVPGFFLDSTKIKNLGFSHKIGFSEGLDRYIDWRKARS